MDTSKPPLDMLNLMFLYASPGQTQSEQTRNDRVGYVEKGAGGLKEEQEVIPKGTEGWLCSKCLKYIWKTARD